jgi:hypothetical protein
MATCNRCGAETQLYDTGYPICIACSNISFAKPAENVDLTEDDAPMRLTHD